MGIESLAAEAVKMLGASGITLGVCLLWIRTLQAELKDLRADNKELVGFIVDSARNGKPKP